jgi:hypothetical protein
MLSYNGMINELDPLNSSITQGMIQKLSREVFGIPCHNGMNLELDPLNSSTRQRSIQE